MCTSWRSVSSSVLVTKVVICFGVGPEGRAATVTVLWAAAGRHGALHWQPASLSLTVTVAPFQSTVTVTVAPLTRAPEGRQLEEDGESNWH